MHLAQEWEALKEDSGRSAAYDMAPAPFPPSGTAEGLPCAISHPKSYQKGDSGKSSSH